MKLPMGWNIPSLEAFASQHSSPLVALRRSNRRPGSDSEKDPFMAQIARTGAGKATGTTENATDNVAELRKRTTAQATDGAREAVKQTEAIARTVQRTAGAAGEAQRHVAYQAAEGTTKLSRGVVTLANEQIRHNLETLKAFTGVVDWDRLFQIQRAYLHISLERATQLTRHYFETVQAVTSATADVAKRQAKKVA
jgi:hypothetical protein